MKSQEILNQDYYEMVKGARLQQQNTPIGFNQAVDVGTSKTRGLSFSSSTNSVNPENIIRVPNEYAILNEEDIEEVLKMEFEERTLNNQLLVKITNKNNPKSPLYGKDLIISKGLISDKLMKPSSFSVSNTSKFKQTTEYIVNTYTSIIASVFTNIVKSLKAGDKITAEKFLNLHVNLACMLPDEEKLSIQAESLVDALKGTVEYELPLYGIKGKFLINDSSTQRLDVYGEAESVIYYFIIKNKSPEIIEAFTKYGVVVADVGEGSFDTVFFKERELITRASSTSREINGSTLVSRTIRNIERESHKNGKYFSPREEMIKRVLEDEESDLIMVTPRGDYDISKSLTDAKIEMSLEIANLFKNALERNSVFGGVDNLFLVIFAGRTMTPHKKSPSLGVYVANNLEKQLDIPASICKVTHPDSNILGAALKMLMYLNR